MVRVLPSKAEYVFLVQYNLYILLYKMVLAVFGGMSTFPSGIFMSVFKQDFRIFIVQRMCCVTKGTEYCNTLQIKLYCRYQQLAIQLTIDKWCIFNCLLAPTLSNQNLSLRCKRNLKLAASSACVHTYLPPLISYVLVGSITWC